MENTLKRKLAEGGTGFVAFVRLPEPGLVEILGMAGLDGVIIDMEHGAFGWAELERMLYAARAAGITPIVRVPDQDPVAMGHALDLGAQGILVPHVEDGAAAAAIKSACLYAPDGTRGVGIGRGAEWGGIAAPGYLSSTNNEVLVGAMIESPRGVEAVAEIARSMDFVFFGAADFASTIGQPGRFDHPAVMANADRVVAALQTCGRPGVAAGFPARSGPTARDAVERGFRLVSLGAAESMLRQQAAALRAAAAGEASAP